MTAGAKTELITIERETRLREAGGGSQQYWTEIAQMWADAKWIGGGESETKGAIRPTARYRFSVYADAVQELNLTPDDRIVWNGERFNIRERPRRQIATPDIDLIAETGVTTGQLPLAQAHDLTFAEEFA